MEVSRSGKQSGTQEKALRDATTPEQLKALRVPNCCLHTNNFILSPPSRVALTKPTPANYPRTVE